MGKSFRGALTFKARQEPTNISGRRFFGPGNALDHHIPKDKADKLGEVHDWALEEYDNKGWGAKVSYSEPDAFLADSLNKLPASEHDFESRFAQTWFNTKKKLAHFLPESKRKLPRSRHTEYHEFKNVALQPPTQPPTLPPPQPPTLPPPQPPTLPPPQRPTQEDDPRPEPRITDKHHEYFKDYKKPEGRYWTEKEKQKHDAYLDYLKGMKSDKQRQDDWEKRQKERSQSNLPPTEDTKKPDMPPPPREDDDMGVQVSSKVAPAMGDRRGS